MKTVKLLSGVNRAFFLLALFVIIFLKSFGQNNTNIYSTVALLDDYFDSIIAIRGIHNMQGTGFKDYCRWKNYWLPKTWPDGNLPNELLFSMHYFQTLSDMGLDQHPLNAIDSSQAEVLSNMMSDYDNIDAWVRNILVSADKISFTEQYLLPEELKSADHIPIIKKKKPNNNYLKTFPNPSKEYVIFEYGLNETESPENVLITITDSRGITHQQLRLKRRTGQMVVVTRHFAPGMYICNLISNKKVLLQSKFSIIR